MKKVELLAPAGSYEAFLGAIHAGADAVYLAGQKYGARAYADNFSEEEVCKAIKYAHLYGRKVYLTVNTLVKDKELQELYAYLQPYAEAGLDGVIIQDLGVFAYIKKHFPNLELHVSTQMTITGVYGAKLLKELGAVRIVPARELSLDEIKTIKEQVDIEIETFIHGAMCYCYSGQCLFSSLLGGRSGNRGRCAQPCRLPYNVVIDGERGQYSKKGTKSDGEGQYPLSLKDMCTIQMIPQLIEAGIDSFKIEGRMKKPEYAAGVTALYRKYIDMYYANPTAKFSVSDSDFAKLKTLYMRSDLQSGYYDRHNGAEMITPHKPSYAGCDETLLSDIRAKYIDNKPTIPITGVVMLKEGLPARLTVRKGNVEVVVEGGVIAAAQKQPLDEDSVRKQIQKTGSTVFSFSNLKIIMDSSVFMPLKALNELRRTALERLEETLVGNKQAQNLEMQAGKTNCEAVTIHRYDAKVQKNENAFTKLNVEVTKVEQLLAVCDTKEVSRVYVPSDLLFEQEAVNKVFALYYKKDGTFEDTEDFISVRPALYIAMPHILRKRSNAYLKDLEQKMQEYCIEGVLVRNLETWKWLQEMGWKGAIQFDANMYVWNTETKAFMQEHEIAMTAPIELNAKEQRQLGLEGMEVVVYGRLPMMITANCIRKTNGKCKSMQSTGESTILKDRYQKEFSVLNYCKHCYNMIYNSVPLSLHQYLSEIEKEKPDSMRLLFTIESRRCI